MKRGAIIGLLVLFVCVIVVGDSHANGLTRYGKNRWNDFLDLFVFQVGLPQKHFAWGAHIRVTDALQVGQVHFEGRKIGLEGRAFIVVNEEKEQRSIPLYESLTDIDQKLLHAIPKDANCKGRPIIRSGRYVWGDGRELPWLVDVEVMVPPCFGGFDIGLSPCQFGDFLLGFTTYDSYGDDMTKAEDEALHPKRIVKPVPKEPPRFVLTEEPTEKELKAQQEAEKKAE